MHIQVTRSVSCLSAFAAGCILLSSVRAQNQISTPRPIPQPIPQPMAKHEAFLKSYCASCHNQQLKSGGLDLASLNLSRPAANAPEWEAVIARLRVGTMPPAGLPRPDPVAYEGFRSWLQGELGRAATAQPNAGRTETFHRLNRTEYQNTIRDLLGLDIDAADLLPADDSSNGFDNMAGTLRISQSLMERYLSAAKTISHRAVGGVLPAVDSKTYHIAADLQQHDHIEGLPFGTRGGARIPHFFAREGDYDISAQLTGTQRLTATHELEFSVDGERLKVETLTPQAGGRGARVAGANQVRAHIGGGSHDVMVTFFRKPADLLEQVREPFENPQISGNDGGLGGSEPVLAAVTIVGPYNDRGPGETPSRKAVFTCYPTGAGEEAPCAQKILSGLAHRAYRGPVAAADMDPLMSFYREGRAAGGTFEAGVELALRRLLVSPGFLFRVEADPKTRAATIAVNAPFSYRLSDLELASRLSFFIWSSIPDEELLAVAERGGLKDPREYERQVKRMMADPRSIVLSTNFADEWLQLRNLEVSQPSYPYTLSFDETLRRSMRRETELFFDSILRENRSTIELLTANYTFLDQRLAEHYGIRNVQGSSFRRVTLADDSPRRGLLGQGSVLTITSHPNRTSPVLRGKFILKNLLGTPPADPPANIPALPEARTQAKIRTMRERMAEHRANPACASCHNMIDPAGYALESFDAIGRFRIMDESFNALDTSGALPDGSKFNGVAELRDALARKPERFINAITEKLLTYAVGRGLEYYDMPAVRKIVSDSSGGGYRLQSIISGVVNSTPFLMRRADLRADPRSSVKTASAEFGRTGKKGNQNQ